MESFKIHDSSADWLDVGGPHGTGAMVTDVTHTYKEKEDAPYKEKEDAPYKEREDVPYRTDVPYREREDVYNAAEYHAVLGRLMAAEDNNADLEVERDSLCTEGDQLREEVIQLW